MHSIHRRMAFCQLLDLRMRSSRAETFDREEERVGSIKSQLKPSVAISNWVTERYPLLRFKQE